MIAAMLDWAQSLTRHGFERIYWLNGHGGNIATITAAFSEIYHGVSFDRAGANRPPLRCMLRNWWELPGVMDLCRQLFPVGEGSHATPSEVSVTWFGYPEAQKQVAMTPADRAHRPDPAMPTIIAAASPTAASARTPARRARQPARKSSPPRSRR